MHFFISTPIYYVNAKPHLGHAYSTIIADSLARFHTSQGKDVFFLTGTDEHGDKIVQAAEEGKCSPQTYVDGVSSLYQNLWPKLGVEYTKFIRTTEAEHKKCVQDMLQLVYDKGDIYFGEYGGHYCYGCERFYTEKELGNGLCPQHQKKPEFIQEKNYFFKMAKYQAWLIDHIKQNREFIRPEGYRNEVLSLLESGALEDLCVSRPKSRLAWGVELPFDTSFVCYVWFDALINYVSALGWPDSQDFKAYWPHAQHLVAKDILKPHAVFWPTMLKAAGLEPYKHLNVHGYWLIKDTKMSKSLGNVVDPLAMAEKYGLAAFRYFLLREMQFGNDASFSEEALVGRFNADLANDLGNLFNRVLAMTHKYFNGVIPAPELASKAQEIDEDLKQLALNATANFRELFGRVMFAKGLDALWELVRGLNKYIDQSAPWTLHKAGDTARLATVMYNTLEGMRKAATHLWPVMPDAARLMLEQLGLAPAAVPSTAAEEGAWGLLPAGVTVAKSSNLFPRREIAVETPAAPKPKEEKAKAKNVEKKTASPQEKPAPPAAIEFTDFQKVDLRVGTVLVAEKHPEADKLLRLEIDLSEERPRQVIAGLAEFWKAEDLVGKQVVVVANLAPRKLRGLESHGMVLAVRTSAGLELLGPTAAVAAGSKVS